MGDYFKLVVKILLDNEWLRISFICNTLIWKRKKISTSNRVAIVQQLQQFEQQKKSVAEIVAEIVAESVATGKIVAAQIIVTILHIVILYV